MSGHPRARLTILISCLVTTAAVAGEPPITALAFAPDGKALVVGSQAGLEVRSWPDLKAIRRLDTALTNIHDLAFAPAGDQLAVAGGTPGEAGTIERYRWPSGRRLAEDDAHGDVVHGVAWRGDGKEWASAGLDHLVLIHGADGAVLHTLEGHSRGVLDLCYLPDGRTLVTAGIDQSLRVWDTASGRPLRTLNNHTGVVQSLALRPGRQAEAPPMVASAGEDSTVRFWQPTIGRMVRRARLESNPLDLAWTPDGHRVVAACADGRLRVVDPESARVEQVLPALAGRAYCVAVAPEGDAVAVGGEHGLIRRVVLTEGPGPAR